MGEQINNLNPIVLGIAVVGVIIILGVIVFLILRSRSRKREDDRRMQSEFAAIDREAQFAAAVEQIGYQKEPDELTRSVTHLFEEYLSMPVLGIYAGREGQQTIERISSENLYGSAGAVEPAASPALPDSLSSSLIPRVPRPQVTNLNAVLGPAAANGSEYHEPVANQYGQTEAAQPQVAIVPWQGPFDWSGIIITKAEPGATAESLARLGEPLARIGERLAVALQLRSEESERDHLKERSVRTTGFAQALLASLEAPAPLASIAQEVASLVGGESAALWRVEPGGTMVRMVAAYGLRSAEFLPLPTGQGLAGTVAQTGSALSIADAPADPRCLFPREAKESGVGSYLGAPLIADGETLGVLEVHTSSPHSWTEDDSLTLQSAAALVAEVVKSTDARGNRLKVESAYLGLSEALQRLRSREEVMGAAVEVLGHALGVSRAIVVEFDDEGRAEPVKHEYHMPNVKSAVGAILDEETAARAVEATTSGEPFDASDAGQSLMGSRVASELDTLSELALPMRLEGKTRALIFLHQCDHTRKWHSDEVEFADRVTRQLALSLSNVRAIDSAEQGARTAASRIAELETHLSRLEQQLAAARAARPEAQQPVSDHAREELEAARAAVATAFQKETQIREERDRLKEDQERLRRSSQQLLEINRLKSEFIVNAGHELEASLQNVLGFADQIEQGAYGPLTAEQLHALRSLHGWAKRMQNDIEWLIEYGSTRSRRLEPKAEG